MQPSTQEIIPQTLPERESLTIRLSPRLNLALDRYRIETGIAKNAIMVAAIEEYLTSKDRNGLDLFREPVQG